MLKNLFVAVIVAASSITVVSAQEKSLFGRPDCVSQPERRSSLFRRGLSILGLTSDQRLICFEETDTRNAKITSPISGLGGSDTTIIGIDYRVQDGKLYGVGNGGGVYTIDTESGNATFINSLTVPLEGTSFGVDFNPAADRLRIISNTGQNLRHNVNLNGVTLVDGLLTYTAPPAAPVAAAGVTAAAYTNNDLDASTATTLFDIDTTLDQVAIQSPANNGILAATGKLGVDVTDVSGFDIYSSLTGGITTDLKAFAVLTTVGSPKPRLYSISLLTGKATLLSGIRSASVVDIALPLD